MVNIFLFFPQDDDTIFGIIQNKSSYKQFVREVSNTLSILPQDNTVKLFYDADNIQYFLSICKKFDEELYLNNAEYQLKTFISPKSINIRDKSSRVNDCKYVLWNLDKLPNVVCNLPKIITEIAEKILSFPSETFLLLNISENVKADRNVLLVCKDAKHIPELPKFARIPYVTDKLDLELWIDTNHVSTFSLLDKSRFTRTNKIEQGQRIYKENQTGNYWYFDKFHRTHYEVFDATGKHIGEADLKGQMDTTKKDNTKIIDI